jgi:hypothetical protein
MSRRASTGELFDLECLVVIDGTYPKEVCSDHVLTSRGKSTGLFSSWLPLPPPLGSNSVPFLGACARLNSCPSGRGAPKSLEGCAVESHPSASLRAGSFAKDAKDGAVVVVSRLFLSPLQGWVIVSHPLPTACAPSTALRAGCGLHSFAASRLGSILRLAAPFGALRLLRAGSRNEVVAFPVVARPNPERVELQAHISPMARDTSTPLRGAMGHAGSWWRRRTADSLR